MFDVKENKAICVLPWVHEYRTIEGKTAPCCKGDSLRDGETLEDVRALMLKGVKPRVCTNCYDTEKRATWSPRIDETVRWINKFGEPDVHTPSIQYIGVRYDPTCNLKCKTCGPYASTLWQKEKGVKKITVNETNKDYLNHVDKKILKKVYLAGGEPTYIRGYLTFLKELHVVNPDCEVIVNTNLKKLPDAWKEIIIAFKNITIVCSCDAINVLGTYIRYPLGWQEFEDNVKFVSENANCLLFNLVASNLNVHKLFEICSWMQKYTFNINLSILRTPEIFSIAAIPPQVREVYLQEVKKLRKFKTSLITATQFKSNIEYMIDQYSTVEYDKTLHVDLKKEIVEQDSHRTLKLQDVDEFLYSWIYC